MANYMVIDNSASGLVAQSFPYVKQFFTNPIAPSRKAYIIMPLKTGYSDASMRAAVVLNNTTIGTIDPRPWTNHFVIAFETVIFTFDGGAFSRPIQIGPPSFGITIPSVNILRIIPQGATQDPTNFLLVADFIFHLQ